MKPFTPAYVIAVLLSSIVGALIAMTIGLSISAVIENAKQEHNLTVSDDITEAVAPSIDDIEITIVKVGKEVSVLLDFRNILVASDNDEFVRQLLIRSEGNNFIVEGKSKTHIIPIPNVKSLNIYYKQLFTELGYTRLIVDMIAEKSDK